jgi:hypothetical protein
MVATHLAQRQRFTRNALFFSRNFSKVIFSHCRREANVGAHVLATKEEGSQSVMWLEEPPDFILHVLADDVSVMPNQ